MLSVGIHASAVVVTVVERPAVTRGNADAQAAVAAQGQALRTVRACNVGGAVGRAVVHDEHVGMRQLTAQTADHGREILLFVPGRYEDERLAHVSQSVRSSS